MSVSSLDLPWSTIGESSELKQLYAQLSVFGMSLFYGTEYNTKAQVECFLGMICRPHSSDLRIWHELRKMGVVRRDFSVDNRKANQFLENGGETEEDFANAKRFLLGKWDCTRTVQSSFVWFLRWLEGLRQVLHVGKTDYAKLLEL